VGGQIGSFYGVSSAKAAIWVGISHAINLSLTDMQKDVILLIPACYFWSDAINAFL